MELEKFSSKIRQLVLADTDDFQDALLILKEEKIKVESELKMVKEKIEKLVEERSKFVTKICDKEFLSRFQGFFSEFERLSNCDKKLLLKAFMPRVIVHADFRIKIKVNSMFAGIQRDLTIESEKAVRQKKDGWEGGS